MFFSFVGRLRTSAKISLLVGTAVAFLGLAQSANANPILFQVSNLTFSAGDPVFDVASDVTFNNLKLSATYTGGSALIPIASTLDTLTILLNSTSTVNPGPLGNLLSVTLTGALSTTSLSKLTTFGGVATPDTAASANFSAILTSFATSNSVNIYSLDQSGAQLGIGTFGVSVSSVPEPASFVLFGAGLLGLALFAAARSGRLRFFFQNCKPVLAGKSLAEVIRPTMALLLTTILLSPSASLTAASVTTAIDSTNWGAVTAPVYGTSESGNYAGAELFAGPNKFGSYYSGVIPSGAKVTPAGQSIQIGMNPLGIALTPDGRFLISSNDDEREAGFPSFVDSSNKPAYSLSVVDTTTMKIVSQTNVGTFFIGLQVTGNAGGPYTVWASGGPDNTLKLFNLDGTGAISASPTTTIPILPKLPATAGYVSNYTPDVALNTAVNGNKPPVPSSFDRVNGAKITFPAGSALSPDGKFLYVACNGDNSVAVIDTTSKTVVQQVLVGKFPYTVAVSAAGNKIAVSNWGVMEYKFKAPTYDAGTGKLTAIGSTGNVPDGFYVPPTDTTGSNPTTSSISLLNAPGGAGSSLSLLGSIYEGHPLDSLNVVGDTHPSAMAIVRQGGAEVLYVTKANSDSIGLVLLSNNRKLPDFDLSPLQVAAGGHAVHGAYPNAIAVSPDNTRVYVAEAGINSVAVLDTTNAAKPSLIGRIPTGWYPTALSVSPDGKTLFVANAKGIGEDINPKTTGNPAATGLASFSGVDSNYIFGSLQKVDLTSTPVDNTTVLANNYAFNMPGDTSVVPVGSSSPSAKIKHVFFILQENKTFDSMLGNLGGIFGNFASLTYNDVNGAPYTNGQYTGVSVNTQQFASKFAVAVNYYSDSEESDAGHQFSASGTASDYTEKTLLVKSGRGLLVNKNFEPEDYPEGGYIFNNAARNGVSFKDYGALIRIEGTDTGTSTPTTIDDPPSGLLGYPKLQADNFTVTNPLVNLGDVDTKTQGLGQAYFMAMPIVAVLGTNNPSGEPRLDLNYPGYNFNISDQRRAQEFIKDFDRMSASGTLPTYIYLYLPNDHTGGAQAPNATTVGQSPIQQVADGDVGIGMVVNHIMNSPVYYDAASNTGSAIFMTYDDAQATIDHIHPHRTPLTVVSPFAKPGYISKRHYITASVVKTEELLLGLPPNNLGDLFATDLRDMFQPTYNGIKASDVPVTRVAPAVLQTYVEGRKIWNLVHQLDTSRPDEDTRRLGTLARLSIAADNLHKDAALHHKLSSRSYKAKQSQLYKAARTLVSGPALHDLDG